ncbi:MFS transporter [Stappia sp. BW2]|uniref:MFS transporter n=1 Tax=Stappia sp. BW2 TaxID=2592622 RepID=UPI0011DEF7EF|nr:MFS transporter [Stappia sp. BW2]TYC79805.1 MFS transporter [Stappia sp. BW2]
MFTRNFLLILLANIVLGSAMPMLIILGGLAGGWLAPREWLATAPPSTQMLIGIIVATPVSLFMGRFGRRAGFLLGAMCLVVGGITAAVALVLQNFLLLCLAHAALGAALISVNYFRFAASEAVPAGHRAQAISFTLASGLVAALLGPQLFNEAKDILAPTPLAGAYLAIAALGILGAVPVCWLRMPASRVKAARSGAGSAVRILRQNPKATWAIGLAALSQAMMVLLMTPTPLAMIGCGFAEGQAADVIRWHVVAMFAPGFFTGSLIRRFGGTRIAVLGLVFLFGSAVTAWSGIDLFEFYAALVLLGVGWNFGFIGGTHLLQAALSDEERPLVQGVNDTLLAISSSGASLLAGVLYAGTGWTGLAAVSAPVLALLALILALRFRVRQAPARA